MSKVKAIIFDKSRHNKVRFVKKKEFGDGAFKHDGNRYEIDPSCYQITKQWKYGWKFEYVTLYYRQGRVKPIPPQIGNGKHEEADEGIMTSREFNAIADEELFSVLNTKERSTKDEAQFYLLVATVSICAYIAWKIQGITNAMGI
jgi:hypothetical protein